jgi:transposase
VIIMPLLDVWHSLQLRAADLGRQLVAGARRSKACQLLMSIPGVGAVTPTAFATAIEDPTKFRTSRPVGAWLGLTTRCYQSGQQVDYDGQISRRGDRHSAAFFMRRRPRSSPAVQPKARHARRGSPLKERIRFKRAAVAVARKLAVTMHAMLRSGEMFNWTAGAAA